MRRMAARDWRLFLERSKVKLALHDARMVSRQRPRPGHCVRKFVKRACPTASHVPHAAAITITLSHARRGTKSILLDQSWLCRIVLPIEFRMRRQRSADSSRRWQTGSSASVPGCRLLRGGAMRTPLATDTSARLGARGRGCATGASCRGASTSAPRRRPSWRSAPSAQACGRCLGLSHAWHGPVGSELQGGQQSCAGRRGFDGFRTASQSRSGV
jgi:hypothetical protein